MALGLFATSVVTSRAIEVAAKPRPAFPALARAVAAVRAGEAAGEEPAEEAAPVSCGLAPTYDHAKTKDYADSRATKYDKEAKKTVDVNFVAGDKIDFECERGYTVDGSKDGETTFEAECTEKGYFSASSVCLEASKCGAVPNISNAVATGKTSRGKVEMKCIAGYSLDGKKVVAGGMGKNSVFNLECEDFSGKYKNFTGQCEAYAFVPAKQTIKIYNKVFEALFIVSCKGTLERKFGKGKELDLAGVCDSFEESKSACTGLVSSIEADFKSKQGELKSHKKDSDKDWFEKDEGRPSITNKADAFCTDLWGLLALPSF